MTDAWTEPFSMHRVWRVWYFDASDPQGYETAARLGLEPFAVADGLVYWKALVREDDLATVAQDAGQFAGPTTSAGQGV